MKARREQREREKVLRRRLRLKGRNVKEEKRLEEIKLRILVKGKAGKKDEG